MCFQETSDRESSCVVVSVREKKREKSGEETRKARSPSSCCGCHGYMWVEKYAMKITGVVCLWKVFFSGCLTQNFFLPTIVAFVDVINVMFFVNEVSAVYRTVCVSIVVQSVNKWRQS